MYIVLFNLHHSRRIALLFSFYSKKKKKKLLREGNIAQLIHLLNVMGFYHILLRPSRGDKKYVTENQNTLKENVTGEK